MTDDVDLVVIGAGPAGIGAALAASESGVDVLIVDEAPRAGGQVYRALPSEFRTHDSAALGPDHAAGDRLRRDLGASRVRTAFGHRVYSVAPGFRVDAAGPERTQSWQARAVIVAAGTHERVIPVPGWTTPGVIGLGAATILLKSQQMLPGEATVVAGCGPLLAAVAVAIIKGGGRVAAVVDLSARKDWLALFPAMASRPDLMARGLGWLLKIRAAGVPILFRHAVTEVRGRDSVAEIVVRPVNEDWSPLSERPERIIAADSLALGHGLVPASEVSRLLRARHQFLPHRGGWVAAHDKGFRTSVDGLYVAGDCAGISGAAAAVPQGKIAGLTAALDLGKIGPDDYARAMSGLRKSSSRAERFGSAMARLMRARGGLLDSMTPETILCRCEDVTRAEIEQAFDAGAQDVNQIKSWTRCGMGPCQGRICGEAAAMAAAARLGDRESAGQWTVRVPLRPVPLGVLVGDYVYGDIPNATGRRALVDDTGTPLAGIAPRGQASAEKT